MHAMKCTVHGKQPQNLIVEFIGIEVSDHFDKIANNLRGAEDAGLTIVSRLMVFQECLIPLFDVRC